MDIEKEKDWTGKTDGMPWMQRSLIFMFKYINIRILYAVMAVVVMFYMVFNHKGYIAMYRFFRKRFCFSPVKAFFNVYMNHYKFGQIILDRFAFYAGKRFDMTTVGNDNFSNLMKGEDGFIMLSSHVGNYELCGYHLKADTKKIYALVFAGETETVMKNRSKMFEGHNINMIPVLSDMSHLFAVNNALSDGNVVSMPGDRVFGSQKSISCKFFGESAKFPYGPFATAVQRELPMLPVFVMKESCKSYRIYVHKIDYPQEGKRAEKAAFMAQEFASLLETTLKSYPTQWFNYYDFWS